MEEDPLARLYDRHAAGVYRFLCAFLGSRDDAADAVHNVFLKLARRGLEGIDDVEKYLWASARNEARSAGGARRAPYLAPRNGDAPDAGLRDGVEEALASLPEEQREVVILHALEGLTFREVGARLGIPLDTAAGRFRYARQKLKEFL